MSDITPKPRGGEAYIYLVEFSDGTVKAGFSTKPSKRLVSHRDNAACFGIAVINTWVSQPHLGAQENERRLLGWCTGAATKVRGAEYFLGVSFVDAVRYADRLRMPRHTDRSFAEHEAQQKAAGDAVRKALFGTAQPLAMPEPGREGVGLDPDDPEHVWLVASLVELALDSARAVLETPSLQEIFTRSLVRSWPMLHGEEEWPAYGYEQGAVWVTGDPISEYWFETGLSLLHEFDRLGIPFNEQQRSELPPRPEPVAA